MSVYSRIFNKQYQSLMHPTKRLRFDWLNPLCILLLCGDRRTLHLLRPIYQRRQRLEKADLLDLAGAGSLQHSLPD